MHQLLEARRGILRGLEARLSTLDLRLRFARARRRLEIADGAAEQAIHLRISQARARLEPLAANFINSARCECSIGAMQSCTTSTAAF